ncbi:hypothetical protein VKT23_009797 [Stygiomarasmius scandens]|uniref:Aminotransferase class I/classII large domain-containing protein n=1 Tax=Marasmiellus scandens TaxID=2682957 RepID=A0ABR1JGP8_9AGAR
MSQGVPGTAPHPTFQKALVEAAGLSHSYGYCPAEGEAKLREGLVEEMKKCVYGRDIDLKKEDIALTAGCNMAFVATIMCLADEGDEVVLPVPWYFNHQMTLSLLGIKTVPLPTFASNGFLPSVEKCKSLLTEKTKAIVLVTPNNPTGAIYPPSLIASFAALAHSHDIALILDETYRDFIQTPDLPPHKLHVPSSSTPPSSPNWRSTIVSLYSFSKSYRIPGHRLGSITASPTFLHHVRTVLDTLQICPPRVAQLALSLPAPSPEDGDSLILHTLRSDILATSAALSSRHKLFRESLPSTWRLASQGGYYAFVRHPFKGKTSKEVCRRLAIEMGVTVLPGSFFCEEKIPEAAQGINAGEIGEKAAEKINEVFSGAHRVQVMDVVDEVANGVTGKELVELEGEEEDRWVRFSVANVDDEKVKKVCERLKESEEIFGWDIDC